MSGCFDLFNNSLDGNYFLSKHFDLYEPVIDIGNFSNNFSEGFLNNNFLFKLFYFHNFNLFFTNRHYLLNHLRDYLVFFNYFSDWDYFLLNSINNDWYFHGDNNLPLELNNLGSLNLKMDYFLNLNFSWHFFDDLNDPINHNFIIDDFLFILIHLNYFIHYFLYYFFNLHINVFGHLNFNHSILEHGNLNYSFNFYHSLFNNGLWNNSFNYLRNFNNLLHNSRYNNNLLNNPLYFNNFWNFHHFLYYFFNWNFHFLNPVNILHNFN